MTDLTDKSVRALLEGTTPGPWRYRPHEFDDWGVVRGGAFNPEWGGYPHLAQVRDPDKLDEQTLSQHRVSGTDPWEGNARLTAAAPGLARALLASRAELAAAQQREAGLRGALSYLRTQAKNGTLHPQVVIQNADASLAAWPEDGE